MGTMGEMNEVAKLRDKLDYPSYEREAWVWAWGKATYELKGGAWRERGSESKGCSGYFEV